MPNFGFPNALAGMAGNPYGGTGPSKPFGGMPNIKRFPQGFDPSALGGIAAYLPAFRQGANTFGGANSRLGQALRTPIPGLRSWDAVSGPNWADPRTPGFQGLNQNFQQAFRTPVPGYSQYANANNPNMGYVGGYRLPNQLQSPKQGPFTRFGSSPIGDVASALTDFGGGYGTSPLGRLGI